MKNLFIKFSLILLSGLLMVQCQKERDKYFEVPDWRGVSIYKTLQDEGRFSKYLQLVDKTQYSASLKGNALWTVFAPNDAAVDAWLAEKGYASVDAVPVAEVNKVVAYSMVYNRYAFDQLSDILYSGWDTIQSVKKKTPYYETIRKELYMGDSIWVIDPVRPNSYSSSDNNDNNYKFLPFYLDRYFSNRQTPLTAEDYNMFYKAPKNTYTGRNIQGASVVIGGEDILASNGIIHEIDRVNEPLPTIKQLLDDPNYAKFNDLIERKNPLGEPYFYIYGTADYVTQYYKTMYPMRNINQVYIKFYISGINCERYQNLYTYEGVPLEKQAEMDGYTIFAPNNDAVDKFEEAIRDYYPSLDEVPVNVLEYFITAQVSREMVWPAEYHTAKNEYNDFINGMGADGPRFDHSLYVDIKPASNGFFYGAGDYVKSRYLESVYSEILLRPDTYSMMNNALQRYFQTTLREELVRCQLNGYNEEDYTVLLITDEQFKELGFDWEWTGSANSFTHARGSAYADETIRRLVGSHVFKRIKTKDIDVRIENFNGNPAGEYDGWAYAVNDYGDMVRYKDGEIEMLGNYNAKDRVKPTLVKEFSNGRVFNVDILLKYPDQLDCADPNNCPEQDILEYIRTAGFNNSDLYNAWTVDASYYVNYMIYLLNESPLPFTLSKDQSWTILMPNREALQQAVRDGYLSDLLDIKRAAGQGNYDPLRQAIDFFSYHCIPGMVYVNDGYDKIVANTGKVYDYMITTTRLKILIDNTFLRLQKVGGNLQISTEKSAVKRTVNVVPGVTHSNIFGVKSVLHEIDSYLAYKPENK